METQENLEAREREREGEWKKEHNITRFLYNARLSIQ